MNARSDRYLIRVALSAALLLATVPAKADWAALSWDACGAHILAKSFACDSNAGEERLVVSALRDSVVGYTSGLVCSLDVVVAAAQIPPWWQMSTAECRAGMLRTSFFPGQLDASCSTAFADGCMAGGIYRIDSRGARLNLLVTAGDPCQGISMTPNLETFVLALDLQHDKSLGVGSCTGCDLAACALLRDLTFVDDAGRSIFHMPLPPEKTLLAWQGTTANCLERIS